MTFTLQQFRRNVGKARRAAAAGSTVVVTESSGASYVFKATTTTKASVAAKRSKPRTFGEMAGHHFGTVSGGPPDLSTNKAYLADFGLKSMGRR